MALADVLLGILAILIIGGIGGYIGAKMAVWKKFKKLKRNIPSHLLNNPQTKSVDDGTGSEQPLHKDKPGDTTQLNPMEVNNGRTNTTFFDKLRNFFRRNKNRRTEDVRGEQVIEGEYSNNPNEGKAEGQERIQIQQVNPVTTAEPVVRRAEQNPERNWESLKQDTSWREN